MDYKTGTGRRGDSVGQPAVGAGGGAAAAPAGGHAGRPFSCGTCWFLLPPHALWTAPARRPTRALAILTRHPASARPSPPHPHPAPGPHPQRPAPRLSSPRTLITTLISHISSMTYLRILSPSLVPLPHAKSLFLSSFTRHTHGSPTPTAAAPPPAARALDKLRGCVRRGTQSTTPLISIHHGTRRRKSSSIHAFAFLFFLLLFLAPLRPPSHPRSLRSLVILLSAHYHPVLLSPHPPHSHSPSPTITTIISHSLSPIFIQPHSLTHPPPPTLARHPPPRHPCTITPPHPSLSLTVTHHRLTSPPHHPSRHPPTSPAIRATSMPLNEGDTR